MNLLWVIIFMLAVQGCQTNSRESRYSEKVLLLSDALEFSKAGEFYRARQLTQEVLDKDPDDTDAQQIMSEIIDAEIALQREAFETKVTEEFTSEETSMAISTWLERSRALLYAKQYEQALLAAERVFLYDQGNIEASRLMDQIKKMARDAGHEQSLIMQQRYEDEIQTRVKQYHIQAKTWMESGRWGAARLAIEKILLLDPKDREATQLYEEIKEKIKQRSS